MFLSITSPNYAITMLHLCNYDITRLAYNEVHSTKSLRSLHFGLSTKDHDKGFFDDLSMIYQQEFCLVPGTSEWMLLSK